MNQYQLPKPSEVMARSPLLLIDDNVENLKLLERMLEWAGYVNVKSCTSVAHGLEAMGDFSPDLVILDLRLPGTDGFVFLNRIREKPVSGDFIPILVFTADLTSEARTKALDLGAADFLTKPGDAIEIQLRVRNFLKMRKLQVDLQCQNKSLEEKVKERTEHLVIARREAIEVLASVCEFRDDETGKHATRVGDISGKIAKEMGLSSEFVETLILAAPLHDVGKIAIPDSILFKSDALTAEEFEVMKRHPGIGASLIGVKKSPLLQMAREIAQYHHERWDGTGYECGLSGEAIPISARIVAVADAFDVLTHNRPYKNARSQLEALEEIRNCSGTHFDSAVVDALFTCLQLESLEQEQAA